MGWFFAFGKGRGRGALNAGAGGDAHPNPHVMALRPQLPGAEKRKASTTGVSQLPRLERQRQASVTSAEQAAAMMPQKTAFPAGVEG